MYRLSLYGIYTTKCTGTIVETDMKLYNRLVPWDMYM